MRKPIILLILVLGTLGAYALSGLLPDTGVFPRIPIGTGSIGSILAKVLGTTSFELSNGRANNSLLFSGISGSGYLHIGNCSNASEVWIGLDADGNPVCGAQKPLLVFGNIETTNGTVTVIRYQDGSNIIASAGLPLYAGDIVITDPASEAEIGFPSDNSILRLDENTNVELQFGTLGGATVAQAIVNDGKLWGRVLTGTGINFGGAGYIAGVRGTSILATMHSLGNGEIIVVHSTQPDAVTYTYAASGTSIVGGPGEKIYVFSGVNNTTGPFNPLMPINGDTMYMMEPWIRENTKRDIVYLKSLADSGALTTAERTLAADELNATRPTIMGGNECQNLLSGPAADSPSQQGSGDIDSTVRNTVCSNTITDDTLACGVQGKIYWSNLGVQGRSYWISPTGKDIEVCQNPKMIGIADFVNEVYKPSATRLVSPLRGSGTELSFDVAGTHGIPTPDGLEISTNDQRLEYGFTGPKLAGKIVTIELTGTSSITSGNAFILNTGNCTVKWNGLSKIWMISGCSILSPTNNGTYIKVQVPTSPFPSKFIIGNNPATSYVEPIKSTIKNIRIEQP